MAKSRYAHGGLHGELTSLLYLPEGHIELMQVGRQNVPGSYFRVPFPPKRRNAARVLPERT